MSCIVMLKYLFVILLSELLTGTKAQDCYCGSLYDGITANEYSGIATGTWYLNTGTPNTCSGQVDKYDVAYYSFSGGEHSVSVALWRPISTGSTVYEMVESSVTKLSVSSKKRKKRASTVGQVDYAHSNLYVRKDTVVGVFFSSTDNSLPIIGTKNNQGHEICTVSQSTLTTTSLNCSSASISTDSRLIHAVVSVQDNVECDGDIPTISHGTSSLIDGDMGYGARVQYSCDMNYVITSGDEYLVCTENDQWSGTPPTCTITCPSIHSISNGTVNGTSFIYQSTLSFVCDTGYQLDGVSTVTCQGNGQWSNTIPTCNIVNCTDPSTPENAKRSPDDPSFTYQSVLVYECNDGYEIQGASSVVCTSSGSWNTSLPLCNLITATLTSTPVNMPPSSSLGTSFTANTVVTSQTIATGSFISSITTGISTSIGTNTGVSTTIYSGMSTSSINTASASTRISISSVRDSQSTRIINSAGILIPSQSVQDLEEISTNSNNSSLGIAVGVTSVLLIALGIAVIIVVIVLVLLRNRKRKLGRFSINGDTNTLKSGFDNCVYEDNNNVIGINDGEAPKFSNPLYEVTDLPLKQQQQQQITYEPIEKFQFDSSQSQSSSAVKTIKGQEYFELEEIPPDLPPRLGTNSSLFPLLSAVTYETPTELYSTLEERDEPCIQEESIYWQPEAITSKIYEQLVSKKYREIPADKIIITCHLGSGQFGTVEKGLWYSKKEEPVVVAIKTLKGVATEEEEVKFLQEAAINGQFHHPNVVELYGVVTTGQPNLIILEYIPNGDLRAFLENKRPQPGVDCDLDHLIEVLTNFSHQIANGMLYLSSKRFIHRDLAARNILVGDNNICKIADFGMSRDLQYEAYYRSTSKRIPVRWTAPEAIHYRKYSTESDVWSFGALLYEIWSVGYKPFQLYSNQECIDLVDSGFRIPAPPGCPLFIYNLMIMCWNPVASERPKFKYLHTELLKTSTISEEANCLKDSLGSSIDNDKSLYPELQCKYK